MDECGSRLGTCAQRGLPIAGDMKTSIAAIHQVFVVVRIFITARCGRFVRGIRETEFPERQNTGCTPIDLRLRVKPAREIGDFSDDVPDQRLVFPVKSDRGASSVLNRITADTRCIDLDQVDLFDRFSRRTVN
jgi:hypothetical protein